MTSKEVEEAIAFGIISNKSAFINAMTANGIMVAPGISNDDLYALAISAWAQKGFGVIKNILNAVPRDRNFLTTAQEQNVIKKFGLTINPNQKCDFKHPLDCITGATGFIGDLLGGHGGSETIAPTQTQTSSSSLSPVMLGLIIVIASILAIVFRKVTVLVVFMIVVVLGAVLYGIFAKQINTIITGGTTETQTHGGIGAALLALLQFA